ncbi:unnamed protein product [Symbiodinium natans]|uniref:Uncharacterized protein n=1 Tax=Symbiodinium natans TaxID=878477 RepID=A0A812UQ16_9DINO|nr:unnamed protein product [Symbiodinium natans]
MGLLCPGTLGPDPDITTFSACISAVAKGVPENGQLPVALLAEAVARRLSPDVIACTSVISACGKSPQWEMALEVLEMLRMQPGIQPNVVCFSAAISACAKGHFWEAAEMWAYVGLSGPVTPLHKNIRALSSSRTQYDGKGSKL